MLQLAPGLSFCEIDGRFIFLDLPSDRYFAIGGELADSWSAVLEGVPRIDQLAALDRRGLLVNEGGKPIVPCPARIVRDCGRHEPCASTLEALLAWCAVARMRRMLRHQGLAVAAQHYLCHKQNSTSIFDGTSGIHALMCGFDRLNLVMSTIDQCLPLSLALATHLARRGFRPEVVFGVRLGPFRAHCWVECDSWLVNDTNERIGLYQPILRL